MSNKTDKILVIDIEATCWATKEETKENTSEIIEVGVCELNKLDLTITNKTSYIVRPHNQKISSYCTNLTGYTWDILKHGVPIGNIFNKMKKDFGTKTRMWASWGDDDRKRFASTCSSLVLQYPLSQSHLDIMSLFMFAMGIKEKISLTNAMKMLKIEFLGTPHNGADDAYNTAIILKYLFESVRKNMEENNNEQCL